MDNRFFKQTPVDRKPSEQELKDVKRIMGERAESEDKSENGELNIDQELYLENAYQYYSEVVNHLSRIKPQLANMIAESAEANRGNGVSDKYGTDYEFLIAQILEHVATSHAELELAELNSGSLSFDLYDDVEIDTENIPSFQIIIEAIQAIMAEIYVEPVPKEFIVPSEIEFDQSGVLRWMSLEVFGQIDESDEHPSYQAARETLEFQAQQQKYEVSVYLNSGHYYIEVGEEKGVYITNKRKFEIVDEMMPQPQEEVKEEYLNHLSQARVALAEKMSKVTGYQNEVAPILAEILSALQSNINTLQTDSEQQILTQDKESAESIGLDESIDRIGKFIEEGELVKGGFDLCIQRAHLYANGTINMISFLVVPNVQELFLNESQNSEQPTFIISLNCDSYGGVYLSTDKTLQVYEWDEELNKFVEYDIEGDDDDLIV